LTRASTHLSGLIVFETNRSKTMNTTNTNAICINQMIAELRAELRDCLLTKAERRQAERDLEALVEERRIRTEAAYFAEVETHAATLPKPPAFTF
jgi:hypothetical protein